MSWYLKLDDDSLLFPTNFMHHLASLNPDQAVMGGHLIYDGIFSGGAGYFLSNSVLQMLVERASECLKQHVPNRLLGGPEDVIVSLCVKHFFGDQLVQVHIQEMYPLTYENTQENLYNYSFDGVRPYPVSFHWIKNHDMSMKIMNRTVFILE